MEDSASPTPSQAGKLSRVCCTRKNTGGDRKAVLRGTREMKTPRNYAAFIVSSMGAYDLVCARPFPTQAICVLQRPVIPFVISIRRCVFSSPFVSVHSVLLLYSSCFFFSLVFSDLIFGFLFSECFPF